MMALRWLVCVVFLALLLAGNQTFAQEPIPNTKDRMVVLDWSGSMWAKVPGAGDFRFSVAKDLATDLVQQTAATHPGVRMGIARFGKYKDCSDFKMVHQLETLKSTNPSDPGGAMLDEIRNLPDPEKEGKTPLIESIEKAARQLPNGGAIILVTDFVETCSDGIATPCQAYAQLKLSGALDGVELRFVITPVERGGDTKEMEAFSDCTGARFESLHDTSSPDVVAKIIKDLTPYAKVTLQIEPNPLPAIPPFWQSKRLAGTVHLKGKTAKLNRDIVDGKAVFDQVEVGEYQLQSSLPLEKSDLTLRVKGDGSLTMEVKPPIVKLTARRSEGSFKEGEVEWLVTSENRKVFVTKSREFTHRLTPGDYTVAVKTPLGTQERSLAVLDWKDRQPEEFIFDEVLKISTFDLSWSIKSQKPTLFSNAELKLSLVSKADGKAQILDAATGTKQLAIGSFELEAEWNGTRIVLAPITEAESTSGIRLDFDLHPFALTAIPPASLEGRKVWILKNLETSETVRLQGDELRQTLPPGRFEVSLEGGDTRIVEAMPSGKISLKF